MAQMAAGSNITIMRIKEFLGLNENQDGDTKIRVGEMSEMRNFSITKDSHLQIRPGTHTLLHLRTAPGMPGQRTRNLLSRRRFSAALGMGWSTRPIICCAPLAELFLT